jgi:hypothetical protein
MQRDRLLVLTSKRSAAAISFYSPGHAWKLAFHFAAAAAIDGSQGCERASASNPW